MLHLWPSTDLDENQQLLINFLRQNVKVRSADKSNNKLQQTSLTFSHKSKEEKEKKTKEKREKREEKEEKEKKAKRKIEQPDGNLVQRDKENVEAQCPEEADLQSAVKKSNGTDFVTDASAKQLQMLSILRRKSFEFKQKNMSQNENETNLTRNTEDGEDAVEQVPALLAPPSKVNLTRSKLSLSKRKRDAVTNSDASVSLDSASILVAATTDCEDLQENDKKRSKAQSEEQVTRKSGHDEAIEDGIKQGQALEKRGPTDDIPMVPTICIAHSNAIEEVENEEAKEKDKGIDCGEISNHKSQPGPRNAENQQQHAEAEVCKFKRKPF